MRKPPVFDLFPAMALTIWLAPSLANPANAERPKVFPIVGAAVLNTGNRLLKIPAPVCFLIFVVFLSLPQCLCLYLYSSRFS